MVSPRNGSKPSDDVPNNVVVLVDDEDDVAAPEPTRLVHPAQDPPVTGGDSSGAAVNRQLYIWHQIAAHMRRERMLARQLRASAENGPTALMTSPQYYTNNNSNIDPMIQFQAEMLQKQYLLHAHFYQNRSEFMGSGNNINRTGNRPVLGVNPGSRVIRKPSSGGSVSAAARLQYEYMHGGGGAMARPDSPFVAPPTGARVMDNSGQIGLGLGLGLGGGEIEPEGIDLTLKL